MRVDIAFTNAVIRGIFRITCKLDIGELQRIPKTGPAIIVMNHVNFIEAPFFATFLSSPRLAALSKKENLTSPAYRYFASIWNAIPIDRSGVDTESFARCLAWVADGGVLGLAPEGTRSRTGVLQRGKAGVAMLAEKAGAPIWPVTLWGTEEFWTNLKSFRRTPIHLRVGAPFMIEPTGSMTKTVRQEVADEIMASIAALMPERYRGPYAEGLAREPRHLRRI
ncbi:MAG: 1-acyl-sn-glycerol-3-phosphate acyltransferase [Spirochaetae bacterium HGW-Spirochaetae-3]|jgi:1-acyl-sn-glycerol-3-phosphate acyltransferase|nr:MAG: 1-acyl-sn-glycerol-3-phosphate acyltransferase [Spirochaetae bacterium HGW-Spirochaetae-3]